MGHSRQRLPAGISEIAEAIGDRAALELVLWRWARSAERAMARGKPVPRAVSVHVPAEAAAVHPFAPLLGRDLARALSAALPGETITCQVPTWLLDHVILWRGLADMAQGMSPSEVSRRYGKDASSWSRAWNRPERHNPMRDVHENIAAECIALLLRRKVDTHANSER